MAVRSKEIHATHSSQRPSIALPQSLGFLAYLVTFVLAAVALYVLVGSAVGWFQVRLDDIHYGWPRTTHLEGFVGHGEEAGGQPTQFVAVNLDRQVVVIELPGGNENEVRSIPGPYLFGADEALTPIDLSLRDVDNDGYNDLIIDVRREQVVYLNRDGTFRLPTPEEQQHLAQE